MKKSKQVIIYNKPNFNLRSIEMYITRNEINCRMLIHLIIHTVERDTFEHTILFSSLKNNGYKDLNILSHFNPYLTSADYKNIKQNILEAYEKIEVD